MKEDRDVRGLRCHFEYKDNIVTIFEIKKGFSRGGQYHENDVKHILISGKVEYRKEDIDSKKETIDLLTPYSTITLPPRNSDLITALEDSVMIGIYKNENFQKIYQKHSKIVKTKMKNDS